LLHLYLLYCAAVLAVGSVIGLALWVIHCLRAVAARIPRPHHRPWRHQ
jgi:hypothetical protein